MPTFTLTDSQLATLNHVLATAIADTRAKSQKAKRQGDIIRLGGQLADIIIVQDALNTEPVEPSFDVTATNQGTVFHFAVNTDKALDFVPTHFNLEPWQWLGTKAFAIDHRFAPQVVCILRDNGFSVEVR